MPIKNSSPAHAGKINLKRYNIISAFREKGRELLLMAGKSEYNNELAISTSLLKKNTGPVALHPHLPDFYRFLRAISSW
ncbi:MAG: hypothetical protein HIU83_13750 [Proteobacteria bacterium]|nr:hypothetical protein [Pseudomonadota bacterium]